jgi:hypothetical protein
MGGRRGASDLCLLRRRGGLVRSSRLLGREPLWRSDSTGSIAGNLYGAAQGMDSISPRWLSDLELRDVIQQVADDEIDGVWHTRYPGC